VKANDLTIKILQTPIFAKTKKKLNKNQIKDLDKAVRKIAANPQIGQKKIGDISDVWVYKFRMAKQENLLAHKWDEKRRILIALGVHENFYRDLKKHRNF